MLANFNLKGLLYVFALQLFINARRFAFVAFEFKNGFIALGSSFRVALQLNCEKRLILLLEHDLDSFTEHSSNVVEVFIASELFVGLNAHF